MRDELYETLRAPRETEKEIRDLTDQIYELLWTTVPGAIRYDLPKVQTSPQDQMAEVSAQIDLAQRRLVELCRRKQREQDTIRQIVMRCVDLTKAERQIIRGRYIACESWERISYDLDLTDRRVYQIHRSACDKLEAFLWPQVHNMSTISEK